MLMLNKHTRRRFIWWFDSFRAKEDPFTSIIKSGPNRSQPKKEGNHCFLGCP